MESAHKHHQLIVAGLVFFSSFSVGYIGYSGIRESLDESLAGIESQVANLSEQMAAAVNANIPELALDGVGVSADGEFAVISYRKKGNECAYLVPTSADTDAENLKKTISKKQAICKASGIASNVIARKIEDFPFLKESTTRVRLVRIPKTEDMTGYINFLRSAEVSIDYVQKEITLDSVTIVKATNNSNGLTAGQKYIRVRYTKNINDCARLVETANNTNLFSDGTKEFCGKNLNKKIITEYRPLVALAPLSQNKTLRVALVSKDGRVGSMQSVTFANELEQSEVQIGLPTGPILIPEAGGGFTLPIRRVKGDVPLNVTVSVKHKDSGAVIKTETISLEQETLAGKKVSVTNARINFAPGSESKANMVEDIALGVYVISLEPGQGYTITNGKGALQATICIDRKNAKASEKKQLCPVKYVK